MFVNSIKHLRSVGNLLKQLKVPAYLLHAHMQQRQRLKNLDRFKASTECVLVVRVPASARGGGRVSIGCARQRPWRAARDWRAAAG